MHLSTIEVVFAAWLPAVALLFRAAGPRRAAPIAVLAGFLLLPREAGPWMAFDLLSINKRTVSGVALLLGVLASDPRALFRGRPQLLDLPMASFVLLPLASLAANGFADHRESVDQVWRNFAEWAVPYLLGRLYLGDRDGPRRISVALAVAGLLYIPIILFEAAMGPDYYLLGRLYGIGPHLQMVSRLGGWRPEGFLTNGIELTTWMALAATVAAWLGLRRAWPSRGGLRPVPALALSLATVACRGVYGYADLALGLAAAGISQLLRTRFLIAALALVPPAYLGARLSGAWDGRGLVELAARAGKGDTVAYRLRAEDAYVAKVFEHGPAFGFGGTNSAIYDYFARAHLWPDGWWVHQLRSGGIVGLASFLLAFFLVPAALALALPAGRSGRDSPGGLAWGLALFLALHMMDSLQNMALMTPTPLIGGALVGLFLGRHAGRLGDPSPTTGARPTPSRIPTSLVVTALVLVAVEILGRRTRILPALASSPSQPTPTQPAPAGDSPKGPP